MLGQGPVPVQNAMGGVSVGLPLDSATTFSNPAGMSLLTGRTDIGFQYFKPMSEYKATDMVGTGYSSVASGNTIETDRQPYIFPAIGFILPINDKLTYGMGLYVAGGGCTDYAADLYGSANRAEYGQQRLTPSLSYKINNMVSVGATLNIMYASLELAAGSTLGQQPHMGGNAYGVGATLGVLVKPLDYLQVGLAYETKGEFQDFSYNTSAGTDKIRLESPPVVTLGLGYLPTKDLTVGFDVEWIGWSRVMGENQFAYTQNSSGAMPINLDWSDQWVYKLGVQYMVHPMVALRAGYSYGKSPVRNDGRALENILLPALSKQHITGGIGVNLTKQLALNLSVLYTPEEKVSGSNVAGQYISSYESKFSTLLIDLGLAYKF